MYLSISASLDILRIGMILTSLTLRGRVIRNAAGTPATPSGLHEVTAIVLINSCAPTLSLLYCSLDYEANLDVFYPTSPRLRSVLPLCSLTNGVLGRFLSKR